MNYQRMIEILEATKKLRQAKKNSSPYVCDNLEEVVVNVAKEIIVIEDIREDIRECINQKWGVVDYLEERDNCHYTHSDDVVLNFRVNMIDDLIQRYRDKLVQPEVPTNSI